MKMVSYQNLLNGAIQFPTRVTCAAHLQLVFYTAMASTNGDRLHCESIRDPLAGLGGNPADLLAEVTVDKTTKLLSDVEAIPSRVYDTYQTAYADRREHPSWGIWVRGGHLLVLYPHQGGHRLATWRTGARTAPGNVVFHYSLGA